MPAEKREAKRIDLARQGDPEAFGDLYELYLDEVYRFVFYRIDHKEDAEDLTEHVFVKAWTGLSGYRGEVPFKSWIYRIARNAVVDYYRKRKAVSPFQEQAFSLDGDSYPEASALAQETSQLLAEAISRQSPLHQDVLILRFINGLSTEETARILERSAGAIRVLQHRALMSLKSYLLAGEIING